MDRSLCTRIIVLAQTRFILIVALRSQIVHRMLQNVRVTRSEVHVNISFYLDWEFSECTRNNTYQTRFTSSRYLVYTRWCSMAMRFRSCVRMDGLEYQWIIFRAYIKLGSCFPSFDEYLLCWIYVAIIWITET